MSLETQLSESMVAAMKAKDSSTLTALRGIKAAFLNLKTSEEFAGKEVTEEAKLKALQKMVKQRNDSATIFKEKDRNDLYETEVFEISIIEKFLPKKMSEVEIEAEVKQAIAETGAKSPQEMGKVMGVLTKKLAGKADGKTISDLVKKLLA
jgi:uncharacterized protein YqeY